MTEQIKTKYTGIVLEFDKEMGNGGLWLIICNACMDYAVSESKPTNKMIDRFAGYHRNVCI